MRPYPPLGLLYISSYLEQHGIENSVFDTTFSTREKFESYLLENKPTIIGIYVNLMTRMAVLSLQAFIRKNLPDTIIILGGPEVRHSAANFLKHGADYIVMGEGEESMRELCCRPVSNLREKQEVDTIQGVAFLKNGEFIQTPEREKIKDLDALPLPNRSKIDIRHYLDTWKRYHGKSTLSVSTMRGCPYTCKWCSRAVYGLSYRRRSPEQVVNELAHLQESYKPDSLWFVDDVFTISYKWMRGFSDELRKQGIQIPYECITRADRMNEEIVQLLKETGCFRVWIGAESGSQKVIDLMDRRVQVTQVRDMIQLSKKFGIESGTFIMLGYPGETEADIEETINHLKQSNPDLFTITVAYPIRGTELFEEVQSLQTTSFEWSKTSDREIDFKRTYARRYYDFAVRRVVNEMNYFKASVESQHRLAIRFKIKSLLSKVAMRWIRTLNYHES